MRSLLVFFCIIAVSASAAPLTCAQEIGNVTYTTNQTIAGPSTWNVGDVTINNAEVTLTNTTSYSAVTPTNRTLQGTNGQLTNQGLFQHTFTAGNDNLQISQGATFLNDTTGEFRFTNSGDVSFFVSPDLGGTFINRGLLRKTGGGPDPTFFFGNGNVQLEAGEVRNTDTNSLLAFSTDGSNTSTAAVNWNAQGGDIKFGGVWSGNISGSSTGSGEILITFDGNTTAGFNDDLVVGTGGLTLNVSGGGVRWENENINTNGVTLTNQGVFVADLAGAASGQGRALGQGVFRNEGTVNITSGVWDNSSVAIELVDVPGSSFTIDSGGTFLFAGGSIDLGTDLVNDGLFEMVNSSLPTPPINGLEVTGTSTFVNNGTLRHSAFGGRDNLLIADALTIDNQGTIELATPSATASGDIQFTGDGVINNSGIFRKAGVNSTDRAYVFTFDSVGQFNNLAGGEVISDSGNVTIAVGGTSDAASAWTANGGIIQLSGTWGGTFNGAGAGEVLIGNSGNGGITSNFTLAGDVEFNLIGGGLAWTGETIDTQGNTFTNSGNMTMRGTTRTLASTGTAGGQLVNDGTVTWESGILQIDAAADFVNSGTLIASTTATKTLTGNGDFIHTGDLQITGGSLVNNSNFLWTEGSIDTTGGDLINTGTFTIEAGGVKQLIGGTLDNQSTLNHDSGTVTLIAGGTLENNGTLNLGTGVGFGYNGTGTVTNNGTAVWQAGQLNLGSGITFLNSSTGTFDADSTGNMNIAAGGNFRNEGTLDLNGGDFTGDGVVTNAGTTNLNTGVNLFGQVEFVNEAGATFNWNDGNINIAAGAQFTNEGFIEYLIQNSGVTGSGTFLNRGTIEHNRLSDTNDNFQITNAMFDNEGTFRFNDNGDLELLGAAEFNNSGLFEKAVAGADPTFIFRQGDFNNLAGGTVRSEAGLLSFSTDGNNFSDAAATWEAAGGDIHVGGTWSGTIAGSATGAGQVLITDNGNGTAGANDSLVVGTGGLTLNISDNGVVWDRLSIDTSAGNLVNAGQFRIIPGGTKTLTGNGVFDNQGTLDFEEGAVTLAGTSSLQNNGVMNIINSGTAVFNGTGTVNNFADVNISANLDVLDSVDFVNEASGTVTWTGGNIEIAPTAQIINNGTFDVDFSVEPSLVGGGTFVNNGVFNHLAGGANDNLSGASGEFINNGLFDFQDEGDFQIQAGYTFTNAAVGTIRRSNPGGSENVFFSFGTTAGTFDNQGTVETLGGTIELRTSASSTSTAFADITLVQWDGATQTLTGGTWIADATAGPTATIDLQPANAGILTIGSGAEVQLLGANASLPQLVNSLETVEGRLIIENFTLDRSSVDFVVDDGGAGDANGVVQQTGGLSEFANLAVGNANTGTFELNGGTVVIGDTLEVGSEGTGVFNQDGTVEATTVAVGTGSAGSGAYNLDGGTLSGTGATNLALLSIGGGASGGTGEFNLNAGSISSEQIDVNTGGTFNSAINLSTDDTVNVLGGTANLQSLEIESAGNFNVSEGTANIAGSLDVSGVATQTGGTTNVFENFNLSTGGTYTLTDGRLDFGDNLSGNAPSEMLLAAGSDFDFNGGTLQDVSSIRPADGTFEQDGGAFVIGREGIGPAAITTIDGGFEQAAGSLEVDIFGQLDSEIDRLVVNGDVFLDGEVLGDVDPGVEREMFEAFTVLISGSGNIELGANFSAPGFSTRFLDLSDGSRALQLITPEPGSISAWLILGMFGYFLSKSRQNRKKTL